MDTFYAAASRHRTYQVNKINYYLFPCQLCAYSTRFAAPFPWCPEFQTPFRYGSTHKTKIYLPS